MHSSSLHGASVAARCYVSRTDSQIFCGVTTDFGRSTSFGRYSDFQVPCRRTLDFFQLTPRKTSRRTRFPGESLSVRHLQNSPLWNYRPSQRAGPDVTEAEISPVDIRSLRDRVWALTTQYRKEILVDHSAANVLSMQTLTAILQPNAVLSFILTCPIVCSKRAFVICRMTGCQDCTC